LKSAVRESVYGLFSMSAVQFRAHNRQLMSAGRFGLCRPLDEQIG
jgi:hypothetical protein